MAKKKSKKPVVESRTKLRPDVAETAYRVMQEATGQRPKTEPGSEPKNPEAVKRGRAGGQRGGKARAKRLTPAERTATAKKAAAARWKPAEE
jgi:hypothetical protein